MRTVEDIKKLKVYCEDNLYNKTRAAQKEDKKYIYDTFQVDDIKAPHKVLRSGLGRAIVDAAAEQLITSNPQASFDTGDPERDVRLSKMANSWLDLLKRKNPHAIKEAVKDKEAWGESYIQLVHNERWVVNPIRREGLPVLFLQPNPMVVYGSPKEDDSGWMPDVGVPNWVLLFFEMQTLDVITQYPSWKRPADKKDSETVTWIEYWDKDIQYCEADGEVIVRKKNKYGFTPFVRSRSGFGQSSEDGELSNLIMSDIRFDRDLLYEECVLRSNISSINNLFAHKPRVFWSTDELTPEKLRQIDFGSYGMSALGNMPEDFKPLDIGDVKPVTAEMEQHYRDIKAEIVQRHPFLMAGFPIGSSGRQQGKAEVSGLRRYNTVVENTGSEFSTAIEMAFAICGKIPTLKPKELNKGDLDNVKCKVELKVADPTEKSAQTTLGDRLWDKGDGSIDLETNHMQYMGMTLERSKKVKAKILAEKLTLFNPNVNQVYALMFAEEANLQDELARIQGENEGMTKPTTPSGEQRIKGEAQTPEEMPETNMENRGARKGSEGYSHGEL